MYCIVLYLEPSASPGCYHATAKSPNGMLFEWCALLPIDENGPLAGYSLTYAENKFSIPVKNLKLNETTFEYLVKDLEEDDVYTFNLSAVNSIGDGPKAILIVQTDQKSTFILFLIKFVMLIIGLV